MNTPKRFDIKDFVHQNPPPAPVKLPPTIPTKNGSANGHKNDDPSSPGLSDPVAKQPDEVKPQIIVDHDIHRMTEEVIDVLRTQSNIYKRYGFLAEILTDPGGKIMRHVDVKPGTPKICEIKIAKMHAVLTKIIDWVKYKKDPDSNDDDYMLVPTMPPDKVVAAVMHDMEWKGLKNIEVIAESPLFLADGTILQKRGFNEETGIYYEPNGDFEDVPENVSLEQAQEAAGELADLVSDFPFQSRTHKASWLAALLTPFARFAIPEPCPIFMFDANTAGTGKSLLCDIISILVTGREMPRTTYPDSDEEMRKRATSIALFGSRLMLLDNIATSFGGATLDAMLTGVSWGDRILGKSEMTQDLLLYTVWYGTGNNLTFRGDMCRRVIVCRLVTDEQNPEVKSDFKYARLKDYVSKNRSKYVRLCLTILRGFYQAGSPAHPKPLGTFGAWSDIVRSCVIWSVGEDCVDTQDEFRRSDPQTNLKIAIIKGLGEIPEAHSDGGITIAEILQKVAPTEYMSNVYPYGKAVKPSKYVTLAEALYSISGNDKFPSARQLGYKFRSLKDSVVDRKRLTGIGSDQGVMKWRIDDLDNPEHQGRGNGDSKHQGMIIDTSDADEPEELKGDDYDANTVSGSPD